MLIRYDVTHSRSRHETKVAEALVWPRKDSGCDVNSNFYTLPPPSAQPPSSPPPSSLPPYVSHLTVKELEPSWTNPRHQRSSSVSSSSTGSLGSSAFPPHQTPTPKTSIGFASDRAGTPHNNSYRMQQDTHRSDNLLWFKHLLSDLAAAAPAAVRACHPSRSTSPSLLVGRPSTNLGVKPRAESLSSMPVSGREDKAVQ